MRGLAITGPTGAGKTTIQRHLVDDHGFWTPSNLTTRSVAEHEVGVEHVEEANFNRGVIDNKIVIPFQFGGAWYGWSSPDYSRLLRQDSNAAVVNVRPYTALVLSATIPDLLPVWLFAEPELMAERRTRRGESRDLDELRARREALDELDLEYVRLFKHQVPSNHETATTLLRLMRTLR